MSNFPSMGTGCGTTDNLHTWIAFNSHDTDPLDVNGFSHEPNSNSRWLGVSILQNDKQDTSVSDPTLFKWVRLSQVGGGAGGNVPPQSSSYIKFSEFEDGINPTTNLSEFTTQSDKLNFIGIALNIPNNTAPTNASFYGWFPYNSSSSQELVAMRAELTNLVNESTDHENSIDNLQINDAKRADDLVKLTDRVRVLETNPPSVSDTQVNEISARSLANQAAISTFQAKVDKVVADTDKAINTYGLRINNQDSKITQIELDNAKLNTLITNLKVNGGSLPQAELDALNKQIKVLATKLFYDIDVIKNNIQNRVDPKLIEFEKTFKRVETEIGDAMRGIVPVIKSTTENLSNCNKTLKDLEDNLRLEVSQLTDRLKVVEVDNTRLNSLIEKLGSTGGNLSQAELDTLKEQVKKLNKLTSEIETIKTSISNLSSPTNIQTQLNDLEQKLQAEIDKVVASIQRTPLVHVKFSEHPTGRDLDNNISFLSSKSEPSLRKFMGIATGDQEPTLPEDYTWTRASCDDDKIHIKYSAYEFGKDPQGQTMFTTVSKSRKYMGVYVGKEEVAPNDPNAYTWSQIRGDTPLHVQPLYSYTMYARDNKGTDLSPLPDDRKWIGFVNNWEYDSAPTDHRQYHWVELVGKQGNPGKDGKDGKNGAKGKDGGLQYIFMRFSEYNDGEASPGVPSFTEKPNQFTKYIGWSFNNRSSVAPTEADDYFWYTLPKGVKGDIGPASTIHVAYSVHINGRKSDGTSGYYDDPTLDTFLYMGIRVVPEGTEYVRDDASLYKWVRIKGDAGISLYTHIGFSNYRSGVDEKGTFSISLEYTGQRYMLINRNNPSPNFPIRPDSFGTILDLGLMAGTAKGLTQEEVQAYLKPTSDSLSELDKYARAEILKNSNRSIANASAISKVKSDLTTLTDMVKPTEIQKKLDSFNTRLRINEKEVTSATQKADEAKTEASIAFNDTTDLKVDMSAVKATVEAMRIKVVNIEANVNVGGGSGSGGTSGNTPTDLAPIQEKLNKLEADLTPVIADVSNNRTQLNTYGNRIGVNENSINNLSTEIQNLKDTDTSLASTIASVNDSVIRVENRIDDIVTANGNTGAAEIQTVRRELNDLRTKHNEDIADVKQTRASKSAVNALRANIGEVSSKIGDVRRENQQMEDRVTKMEITHERFAPKKFVTDLVDPLKTDYIALKATVDSFNVEIKTAKSDAASAVSSSQGTSDKVDKFEPRITDCETKIKTIGDDLSNLQVTQGVSAKDLSDLDTKLTEKVTTLEASIEPKIINIVDKRVSNLSSTSQPANVVALTNRVDAIEKRVNTITGGASDDEVKALKAQMTDLLTQLGNIETQVVEIKYSANKDGSDATDTIQSDSEFFGIKITKQKLI